MKHDGPNAGEEIGKCVNRFAMIVLALSFLTVLGSGIPAMVYGELRSKLDERRVSTTRKKDPTSARVGLWLDRQ